MRKLAFGVAAAAALLAAAPASAQYFEFGIGPRGPSFYVDPGYPSYYSGRPYRYYGSGYRPRSDYYDYYYYD